MKGGTIAILSTKIMSEIINNLTETYGCATFIYKGKKCGVEPETVDDKLKYYVWFGDDDIYYDSIEDLKKDKFFDGLTILEVEPLVEVDFC